MPKDKEIRSILLIGSGPIIIGQACEFDYSGSQASRSLRSEGIEVTLINSNPATIMTDPVVADNIYLKPPLRASLPRAVAGARESGRLVRLPPEGRAFHAWLTTAESSVEVS